MNYDLLKLPILRYGIYTDLKYNIYNDFKNEMYSRYDMTLESGRINLTRPGLGYYCNPTLNEFVRTFILGCVITQCCQYSIDTSNPFNSVVNNRKLNLALKYRLNCLFNYTTVELKFWKFLSDNRFSRSFRKLALRKFGSKRKSVIRRLTTQAITPIDNRFYIADYVIQIPGYSDLVIELDGKYHNDVLQEEYDLERTINIGLAYDINLIRISNEEFLSSPDLVYEKILDSFTLVNKDSKVSKIEPEVSIEYVLPSYSELLKKFNELFESNYYFFYVKKIKSEYILKCYYREYNIPGVVKAGISAIRNKAFKEFCFNRQTLINLVQ